MGSSLKGFTLFITTWSWFFHPSLIQSLLSCFLTRSSFTQFLIYSLPIPTSPRIRAGSATKKAVLTACSSPALESAWTFSWAPPRYRIQSAKQSHQRGHLALVTALPLGSFSSHNTCTCRERGALELGSSARIFLPLQSFQRLMFKNFLSGKEKLPHTWRTLLPKQFPLAEDPKETMSLLTVTSHRTVTL